MAAEVAPGIERLRAAVNASLESFLDDSVGADSVISEPVRYAVLGPGKRIRPLLLMATYRALGGRSPAIARLACSVELVHAYSLVHDDLPCMDDDILRRGRPTLHVEFGNDVAVVAGAALMPLAVEVIQVAADEVFLDRVTVNRLIGTLTEASGARGMVGGQILDLWAEGQEVDLAELESIHRGKTAALMAASVVMGGIAAGLDGELEGRLQGFGLKLGLAFQAVDDILDMRGTDIELGKHSGRDVELRKATYPAVLGIGEAERVSRTLVDAALAEISFLTNGSELREIAEYVVRRRH
jgi:geranylgeranyl pyrophosphate synthase